ncbi:MAG TPA: hypothetical protein VIW29_05120, partial [Polyangiaceae bacterium]
MGGSDFSSVAAPLQHLYKTGTLVPKGSSIGAPPVTNRPGAMPLSLSYGTSTVFGPVSLCLTLGAACSSDPALAPAV